MTYNTKDALKQALETPIYCNLLWGIAFVNGWNQTHHAEKGKGKRLKYQAQQTDFRCSSVARNKQEAAYGFEHMAECR